MVAEVDWNRVYEQFISDSMLRGWEHMRRITGDDGYESPMDFGLERGHIRLTYPYRFNKSEILTRDEADLRKQLMVFAEHAYSACAMAFILYGRAKGVAAPLISPGDGLEIRESGIVFYFGYSVREPEADDEDLEEYEDEWGEE